MNQTARYSIVRFLPYAETEEFANVGVVLFAPGKRYFDFRLNNKWRRIGAFFEPLERRVFAEGIRAFGEELQRTRALAMGMFGDSRGQAAAAGVFEDLVRPRHLVSNRDADADRDDLNFRESLHVPRVSLGRAPREMRNAECGMRNGWRGARWRRLSAL